MELAIPRLDTVYLHVPESCTFSMTRTETGEYEQCSQYVVDWNLVLNGSKPQNHEVGDLKIFDNQILAWKNSSNDWDVGACTDGWEYDTENFHRCVKGNTCNTHFSSEQVGCE